MPLFFGYSEGLWTPVLAGDGTAGTQTYSVQVGNYIRIGNLIVAWCRLVMSAKDAATSGNIYIGGLPFTSSNITGEQFAAAISQWSNIAINTGGGYTNISCRIAANDNRAFLVQAGNNVGAAFITDTAIVATSSIGALTCTYRTG